MHFVECWLARLDEGGWVMYYVVCGKEFLIHLRLRALIDICFIIRTVKFMKFILFLCMQSG